MDIGSKRIVTLLMGELQFVPYIALLLTIPIFWVLPKLYRKAVIQSIEKHANQPDITLPLDTTLVLPPETEVEINNVKPSNLTDPPSKLHGKK